jgi:UDP-N-acetylglucosamine 2-epimerase (non-hydrolysing)/GDP/UDP-N,N'-diacetylbacillosamine 2-epimerase (hydrolysing)
MAVTGTRADYGLMRPVYRAITGSPSLDLDLIVTGMHLLPEFKSSLNEIKSDNFGRNHYVSMALGENSGKAMAQSLGLATFGMAAVLETSRPDILLLQGDRGEMLAGAISAAYMNIPVVHMSGGDRTGSIDDSIRNALSRFAHIHLTTCSLSTERMLSMGEHRNRIREVGEPGLDAIKAMSFSSRERLVEDLGLDPTGPLVLATQHPVTTEAEQAAWQISQTLEALAELSFPTVFTYPNTDTGGKNMVSVLESYRTSSFIRIVPSLGSEKYLSLMKAADVVVGNSSSGIIEAPSFKTPVVNIGSRQYGRLRANNVVDVGYDKGQIKRAILFVLEDEAFRKKLSNCRNPYGDGNTAKKVVDILTRLAIKPSLLTKWIQSDEEFLSQETVDSFPDTDITRP